MRCFRLLFTLNPRIFFLFYTILQIKKVHIVSINQYNKTYELNMIFKSYYFK